jgi:hypothetical protein
VGYATRSTDFVEPGARRRFAHYAARRGLNLEPARPDLPYDLVVVTAMSDLGAWRRAPKSTRLIVDLVDSYLDVPSSDWRAAVRGLAKFTFGRTRSLHLDYRRLIEVTCQRAEVVVCANEEQRSRLLQHAPRVHPILDFLTELPEGAKDRYARGDTFHLVWEGLPWNLATFRVVRDALRELRRHERIALHLVTALERPFAFGDLGRFSTPALARRVLGTNDVYLYQWNVHMLPALCAASDLAIIPIPREDPFMWAKPENKLLGFWRMGLPVVTSPTPAYARVMKAAGLELTCGSTEEWVETLGRLMVDEAARREAAERGRAYARLACDEDTLLARWDAVLGEALLT